MLMIVLKAIFGTARIILRAEQLTYAVGFVVLFAFLIWITGFDIAEASSAAQPVTLARRSSGRVRRPTVCVDVGGVLVGSAHPVVVQSMTNTDTADPDATAIQVARLAHAGSQLVRVTVNTDEAAAAVPEMVAQAPRTSASTCRSSATSTTTATSCWSTIRRWPRRSPSTGSTPATSARSATTSTSQTIVRVAIDNGKPVRIGVNWGSLDQQLLTELMEANARAAEPRDARDVMIDAMVESAMRSAELAEETGLGHDRIILSREGLAASATSSTSTACSRRAPTTRSTSA